MGKLASQESRKTPNNHRVGEIESLNNYQNTLYFIEDKMNNVNFIAVYLGGNFNADVGGGRLVVRGIAWLR